MISKQINKQTHEQEIRVKSTGPMREASRQQVSKKRGKPVASWSIEREASGQQVSQKCRKPVAS